MVGQLDERAARREAGHHLGAQVADFDRRIDGLDGIVVGLSDLVHVEAGPGDHVLVADCDVQVVVLSRQRDAAFEVIERGAHAAARIMRVSKPAQGARFVLRVAGLLRIEQRFLVLFEAAVHVPEREVQIAAQMVDAGKLPVEALLAGELLRLVECCESAVVVVGDAHAFGNADQCATPAHRVLGDVEGLSVGVHGHEHRALIVQELARLQPVADGLLGKPGFGVVVREQRGLRTGRFRKALLEHLRDASVILLAGAAQQRGVGCILHERVLELVADVRRQPVPVHELGVDELGEGVVELGPIELRHRHQQLLAETPPDGRRELGDLLDRRQPVEARHERVLQRCRYRQRRQRAVEGVAIAGIVEQSGLEHGLGQLLDEKRHAVGLLNDLIEQLVGQRLAAGDLENHVRGLAAAETVQRDHRHLAVPAPR